VSLRIIGAILFLFALNWFRLRQGETVNRLYDKLNIEPILIRKYTDAYKSVSDHISKEDYTERAESFHRDFQYDIVRYMNTDFPRHKLKALKVEVKKKTSLSFDELPPEIKTKAHELSDNLIVTLLKASQASTKETSGKRRRRR